MLFRRKVFKWRRQDHGRAQAQTDVVRELGHVSHLIHIGSSNYDCRDNYLLTSVQGTVVLYFSFAWILESYPNKEFVVELIGL